MAPGGRICKEVLESHSMFSDYGIATSNAESKISPSTKTPIVSGGKYVISSTTGVHDLLECPVCMNSMYPPIHQCPNGHTLCSDCKARVHNCCPTCRYELGNIRCLALEKVAESLELPCRHQALGCHDIFPYYSKLKHEQHCRYRPYNCPYAGSECSVTGDIPILVAHLKEDHKVDTHDGCTFNHRYVKSNPQEVENATWMLTARHGTGEYCSEFHFLNMLLPPKSSYGRTENVNIVGADRCMRKICMLQMILNALPDLVKGVINRFRSFIAPLQYVTEWEWAHPSAHGELQHLQKCKQIVSKMQL